MKKRLAACLLALLALALEARPAQAPSAPTGVGITVVPAQVWIEPGRGVQLLNFDFLLDNRTPHRLRLNTIRVRALDEHGKLILQRGVNRTAVSPSIETLTKTTLEVEGTLCVFNPFYALSDDLPLKTLRYEFFLESEDGTSQYKSEVSVSPRVYETKTELILPLAGRVLVLDGHDFYSHHRRIDLAHPAARQLGLRNNPQRYANDLFVINESGELFRGEGESREAWFGFGVPVYAPGRGTVVRVVNDIPDNRIEKGNVVYAQEVTADNPDSFGGNFVVLDHGKGEFSFLAHFKQGSVVVKVGDRVRQGQLLGQMGLSGDAPEVHLHYQLQDGPDFLHNNGFPASFRRFRRDLGSRTIEVKQAPVDTGDIVETLARLPSRRQ